MKILVTTIVSLNPGDAAILQGTIAILKKALGRDISVSVFDRDGVDAGQYYPWATYYPSLFRTHRRGRLLEWLKRAGYTHRVRQFDWHRLRLGARLLASGFERTASLFLAQEEIRGVKEYLAADLVVANGGTYLVPHYNILVPLLDYEFVEALGKPLVFFPQSMGPFVDMVHRDRLVSTMSRARRIYVRERLSAEHLRAVSVPDELIRVRADAAFALAPEDIQSSDPRPTDGPLSVAISVREWKYFRSGDVAARYATYLDDVAALATHLVRQHGARVTFTSTCQGMPEYWTDDSAVADQVAGRLDRDVANAVRVEHRFRPPLELMQELQGYDVVVATRMHFAILALSAGVPVLGIAYEFKTTELFREMGLESWVVDIEDLTGGTLVSLIDEMLEDLPVLRAHVRSAAQERRASALSISHDLETLLHEG